MNSELRFKSFLAILLLSVLSVIALPDAGFARTVTDETGRHLVIVATPERIVSLAPGITETLYALGLDDKIAGVTTFCDWPQAALAKPRIGGFTNPSLERIIALKPDLILATADGNRKDTVRKLARLGFPVYVTNPRDTQGVLRSIFHIGEITNQTKEAQRLVEELQKRLDTITAQVKSKRKPQVFFQLGLEPVITAGRGTLINEVIERAGAINVAGRDLANYPLYSAEGIISAAPEIIVFAPMVNDEKFTAVTRFWQKFKEVPAVKNNRIYPIDANLINRASPRIVEAIEMLAMMFHPEMNKLK